MKYIEAVRYSSQAELLEIIHAMGDDPSLTWGGRPCKKVDLGDLLGTSSSGIVGRYDLEGRSVCFEMELSHFKHHTILTYEQFTKKDLIYEIY